MYLPPFFPVHGSDETVFLFLIPKKGDAVKPRPVSTIPYPKVVNNERLSHARSDLEVCIFSLFFSSLCTVLTSSSLFEKKCGVVKPRPIPYPKVVDDDRAKRIHDWVENYSPAPVTVPLGVAVSGKLSIARQSRRW